MRYDSASKMCHRFSTLIQCAFPCPGRFELAAPCFAAVRLQAWLPANVHDSHPKHLLGHAGDCNLTDVEQSGKVLKQVGIMSSPALPTLVSHTSRAKYKRGSLKSGSKGIGIIEYWIRFFKHNQTCMHATKQKKDHNPQRLQPFLIPRM